MGTLLGTNPNIEVHGVGIKCPTGGSCFLRWIRLSAQQAPAQRKRSAVSRHSCASSPQHCAGLTGPALKTLPKPLRERQWPWRGLGGNCCTVWFPGGSFRSWARARDVGKGQGWTARRCRAPRRWDKRDAWGNSRRQLAAANAAARPAKVREDGVRAA
jgi:hypothetical protein